LQLGGIIKAPTLALLGEAGPEAVIPLAGGSAGATNIYYSITIKSEAFMGNDAEARSFARKIEDYIQQGTRRTSFAGVNRLGYFPGSSAP